MIYLFRAFLNWIELYPISCFLLDLITTSLLTMFIVLIGHIMIARLTKRVIRLLERGLEYLEKRYND